MTSPLELHEAYRFCPRCGLARAAGDFGRPFQCVGCRYTMFFGPVTAVGGLILNRDGQVLLIERARDPGKGLLGMPGGFVDSGESAEESLRREVLEEVGLEITEAEFLMSCPNRYTYQDVTNPVLDLFYTARVDGTSSIRAEASEVSHWFWSALEASILDRMAFASNRTALEYFLNSSTKRSS